MLQRKGAAEAQKCIKEIEHEWSNFTSLYKAGRTTLGYSSEQIQERKLLAGY